jgi:hypothetical protein
MTPSIVWIKKQWKLNRNPFPAQALARFGGEDDRENGLLFDPDVYSDKMLEAIEKFVLGSAYSGLKFAYLWSRGDALDQDARGFGKSVLLQHLTWYINQDWGVDAFERAGLSADDAAEEPMCAVLTSFDMAGIGSLNAALFAATEYATDFAHAGEPTLAQRLRARLVEYAGTDDADELTELVIAEYRKLRGRTFGPPDEQFVAALVDKDPEVARALLDKVTAAKRTRSGTNYLATLLLLVKAAGIPHVLLACDQLEDLASPNTPRQKRQRETERFRDFCLELLPMADMLSVIVTMHPRAELVIREPWQLADLPSYDTTAANENRVVVMRPIKDSTEARRLLVAYLDPARTDGNAGSVAPFTEDAIDSLFVRSSRKPRDLLRKGWSLIEAGASAKWESITPQRITEHFDAMAGVDDDDAIVATFGGMSTPPSWEK